jgi:hypothetical protein
MMPGRSRFRRRINADDLSLPVGAELTSGDVWFEVKVDLPWNSADFAF